MYVIKYKCYVGNFMYFKRYLGNYFVLVFFWFEFLVKYSNNIKRYICKSIKWVINKNFD